ncbi:hypothetical protein J7337_010541 [Fusarium musae]|uniref:Uncharacterized protein n=1 Tax=Fusarium musae TaxID=1042133 RepID=A0A9P8D999_9HYPO|nr:hypothetical protein J7337_010541 [Fusarium musae]KAG9497673.1 hypothetical protein J7337_010541 [Fusarium musae]
MDDPVLDGGLLFMNEEDFVVDFASDDLESLPWNAPYDTNDAAFADVHQETTFADTVNSVNTNSFNIYSDHINPTSHNTQELLALDTTAIQLLHYLHELFLANNPKQSSSTIAVTNIRPLMDTKCGKRIKHNNQTTKNEDAARHQTL